MYRNVAWLSIPYGYVNFALLRIETKMLDEILIDVRRKMESASMSLSIAAAEIGVGVASMQKHLAGGYVRSDSLAKYRRWLKNGPTEIPVRSTPAAAIPSPVKEEAAIHVLNSVKLTSELTQNGRLNVVDLFCGCGGMSLGFERFQNGTVFRTAMALDIEAPMVRVFNDNHPSASSEIGIARQVDITDFANEAEVQAFYLEHLAKTSGNQKLSDELGRIGPFSFYAFRQSLAKVDAVFLKELSIVRREADYLQAVRELGTSSLGQTSVTGFHNALKLPATGTGLPRFGPLIWYGDGYVAPADPYDNEVSIDAKLVDRMRQLGHRHWQSELHKLRERSSGSGRGQLASAAERIERFLKFLSSGSMTRVKDIWVEWRAQREAIRATYFETPEIVSGLQALYQSGYQVSVLLGGPPCQGFSRIGRGKIRSLREQSVHVHEDGDSVDSRNQLMHQYVLFAAALAPDVFLFENVRHFQAVVRSEGVEYDAADVLAEAISNVSSRGLGYRVARRIVVASQHAVPQARERFVMAGVRSDISDRAGGTEVPAFCLSLMRRRPLHLRVALEGLPAPVFTNEATSNRGVISVSPPDEIQTHDSEEYLYKSWTRTATVTDGHLARPPRADDAALFALMGPGTRWMDYRCDESPTLDKLTRVLKQIDIAVSQDPALVEKLGINQEDVRSLVASANGSLSLRLLLESISPMPGEEFHHLITPTYLAKREGAHGDWLARMDASQPSKTIVSHMAKDTYAFVHPYEARTLSVREAARIQAFPDDYKFGSVGLVDGFRVVGNAVPPLLSAQFAERVAKILTLAKSKETSIGLIAAPAEAA
jgi:site-specific DNA-cytosine methylase